MEERIDKLERVKPMALMGMMGEVAPQWVAKELNKIIDHLNSQDQEEVKNPEYDGIREVERQKFKNIVDTVNKRYPQDAPEEWEEEFMEVLETFKDEICSNFFASSKPLTDFIKQLLLEREREVLNEIVDNFNDLDDRKLRIYLARRLLKLLNNE